MKYQIFLMFGALLLAALACDLPDFSSLSPQSLTGSGNVVTIEEEISDFDQVDISTSFDVIITQAEGYKVVLKVDENFVDRLKVEKQGSTLKIGLDPGVSLEGNVTLEAELAMPELTGIELSGASTAKISGFKSSKNLDVDLSGASSLKGDIETGDVTFDASGSSDAALTGSGGNLNLDASGSSDVDLSEFPVANANLDVSGASSVIANTSGTLDASASGASDVTYLGSPTLGSIETSGSSSIESR